MLVKSKDWSRHLVINSLYGIRPRFMFFCKDYKHCICIRPVHILDHSSPFTLNCKTCNSRTQYEYQGHIIYACSNSYFSKQRLFLKKKLANGKSIFRPTILLYKKFFYFLYSKKCLYGFKNLANLMMFYKKNCS